jgi:hypothetical protein
MTRGASNDQQHRHAGAVTGITQAQAHSAHALRYQTSVLDKGQVDSTSQRTSLNLEQDVNEQKAKGEFFLVADLMNVEELAWVFAKRAHESELIIFNGDSSPKMLEMVLSNVLKYKTLGYDHWIMVATAERDCAALQV